MRKTIAAVTIHVAILVLVLAPPLWVRATGTEAYLETQKMDPRSLFRGHYVILGYKVAQNIVPDHPPTTPGTGNNTVYVKFSTVRPAKFLSVSDKPPSLALGEACIVGRKRGRGGAVDFPQIAQFFAPPDEARQLEGRRSMNLQAQVRTDSRCNAVLIDLVPPVAIMGE